MSERKAFLEKIYIKNFLSLRNVTLPLKPMTVLVGPNASGKSNVLSALYSLRSMMTDEKLPQVELVQDYLWAGKASHITFQLQTEVKETPTIYELEFKAFVDCAVSGRVQFLVSYDNDLIDDSELKQALFEFGVEIVDAPNFLQKIQASEINQPNLN